ncbi:uncharacterized protein PSFLO_05018 [Pseudozyma flocculosa]|uniref:t-SNARE coiled-coil homology domain-containing protein n=1 Tax=Pseudozyma flocculosa TaxID=84751 RepID=A0A5C3F760_9BASI|nr:uncharacterized protein PSFLO_05018 [Pseudozyma flocculosa]
MTGFPRLLVLLLGLGTTYAHLVAATPLYRQQRHHDTWTGRGDRLIRLARRAPAVLAPVEGMLADTASSVVNKVHHLPLPLGGAGEVEETGRRTMQPGLERSKSFSGGSITWPHPSSSSSSSSTLTGLSSTNPARQTEIEDAILSHRDRLDDIDATLKTHDKAIRHDRAVLDADSESLHHQFGQINELAAGQAEVSSRLDGHGAHLDDVDARLASHRARLDGIDDRMDDMLEDQVGLARATQWNDRRISALENPPIDADADAQAARRSDRLAKTGLAVVGGIGAVGTVGLGIDAAVTHHRIDRLQNQVESLSNPYPSPGQGQPPATAPGVDDDAARIERARLHLSNPAASETGSAASSPKDWVVGQGGELIPTTKS